MDKKKYRLLDDIGFIGSTERTLAEVKEEIAMTVAYINKQNADRVTLVAPVESVLRLCKSNSKR